MSSTSGSSVDLQHEEDWRSLGKADARRSGQSHSLVAIFMNWSGQAGAQAARVCMTASTSRSALAGFPVWGAGNPGQK